MAYYCSYGGMSAVNPCQTSPCQHNGTCIETQTVCGVGTSCVSGMNASISYHATCNCSEGYEGPFCEDVVVVDYCDAFYPCEHNGTCYPSFNNYTCNCTYGWSGYNCTIPRMFVASCMQITRLYSDMRRFQHHWFESDCCQPCHR